MEFTVQVQEYRDGVYGVGTGIKRLSLPCRYRNKEMELTVEVQE